MYKLMLNCGSMQGFDRLVALGYKLMQSSNIPGDIVEFGCHRGNTAAFLSAISSKPVWVYDSFQGLPGRSEFDSPNDQAFRPGALAVNRNALLHTFKVAGLTPPTIVAGWFQDLKPTDLPERIAFAHVDGDFFRSISDALRLVYFRLSPGAICFVDDYGHPRLQGVKSAVDSFMSGKPETVQVPLGRLGKQNLHCYFTKQ